MLTASILLAIMILPTMVNISKNSLEQVPSVLYRFPCTGCNKRRNY